VGKVNLKEWLECKPVNHELDLLHVGIKASFRKLFTALESLNFAQLKSSTKRNISLFTHLNDNTKI
jgi:hypothetical protein